MTAGSLANTKALGDLLLHDLWFYVDGFLSLVDVSMIVTSCTRRGTSATTSSKWDKFGPIARAGINHGLNCQGTFRVSEHGYEWFCKPNSKKKKGCQFNSKDMAEILAASSQNIWFRARSVWNQDPFPDSQHFFQSSGSEAIVGLSQYSISLIGMKSPI